MHAMPFLADLVVLLTGSLVVITLSQRLRIPSVIGFLLAGMLVGPSGLGLVSEPENVQHIAELGVVTLLFIIGLELSLEHIKHLKRAFLVGGPLQILATGGLTWLVSYSSGFDWQTALLFALIVSLSSTALVLKIYADRKESETPQARLALALLIFQDFLVVPFLIVVQLLADPNPQGNAALLPKLGLGMLALVGSVWAMHWLLPRILRLLVNSGMREVLLLSSIALCLGAAGFTEKLGFSMGMGAFLMGMLLGNSEYRAQIEAEALPFRTLFTSLFFMAIGMLVQLEFSLNHFPMIVGLTLLVLLIKFATITLACLPLGLPLRISMAGSLALAQIGEFSFVLIQTSHRLSFLSETHYQYAISVTLLSLILTPLLIQASHPVGERLDKLLSRKTYSADPDAPVSRKVPQVLVVGFGLNGKHLARVLKSAGIHYRILDLDPNRVRTYREKGEPIQFGDATRLEILEAHGIDQIPILVTVISDTRATLKIIAQAKKHNPHIVVICRTRFFHEIETLRRRGADAVIAEEFESSIELVSSVMTHLHIPRSLIRSQSKLLREDGYQMLRAVNVPTTISKRILEVLATGTTDIFMVRSNHLVVGKTLLETGLRAKTGASVIAIVKGEVPYPNPPSEMTIEPGDTLVLVGSHEQIESAFFYLDASHADPEPNQPAKTDDRPDSA